MKNANDDFREYSGTETYYRHMFGFYTDGVKALADKYQCYWLIDTAFSYRSTISEPFQVWVLERTKGDKFIVTCTDGNDNKLKKQKIPFSDFQADKATFWLSDGVLMLPSEY